MSAETIITSFLLTCLGCFFSVNLYNILRFRKHYEDSKPYAEIKPPSAPIVYLAGLGTLVYFAEALFYPLIVFANIVPPQNAFSPSYDFPLMPYSRIAGMILTGIGHALFVWSVIARGKYATSWAMKDDHRLVTWGPYHFVRHPSYLGYSLMFIGLLALWPNGFTLIPLLAIPGYNRIAIDEEKLLEQRFRAEYVKYKNRTGRFIPVFR